MANGCCHIARPDRYTGLDPLLYPFVDVAERRLISDVDLLFVARAATGSSSIRRASRPSPEPGSLALLGLGVAGLASQRRG